MRSLDGLSSGLVGLLLVGLGTAAHAAPPPVFDDPEPSVSHNGVVQMEWADLQGEYEVQLRTGERARVVYSGRMPSAHVSGLVDGEYTMKVRARVDGASWTSWSAPKIVTVAHHPMPLVWTLMSLGLLTFVATAAVVVRSSRGVR